DRTGSLHQLALWIHFLHLADGLGDFDGFDPAVLQTHHLAKSAFGDQVYSGDAEACGQNAVVGRGRTAALHVSQDADPDFFFRMHGDGAADQVANRGVAAVFFQFRRQIDAFGEHHEGIALAIALAPGNLVTHSVDGKGNFGNEDDMRAASHAGFEGNPAGVAAHDFNDYCAMVRLSSGVKLVDGIGCGLQGSVEAECHFGSGKIVIYGFGYAHELHALTKQLEGYGHRAVASDGYECVNAQFSHVGNDFIRNIAHNFLTVSSTAIPE